MRTTERNRRPTNSVTGFGLNDQFQDLCDTQRNIASEMGFSCPVEQSTGRGRPRFYISEEVIRGLRDVHGVWKEVAKEVLVFYNSTKATSVFHGSL